MRGGEASHDFLDGGGDASFTSARVEAMLQSKRTSDRDPNWQNLS